MRIRLWMCALVASALVESTGAAQTPTIVPTEIGVLYRYLGDTVWYERDTTVRRIIYHADSVTADMFLNGRRRSTVVYSLDGPVVRLVRTVDSTGVVRTMNTVVNPSVIRAERQLFTMAVQNAQTTPRLLAMSARMRETTVPRSPGEPISYCTDRGIRIVQHGDTTRYLSLPAPGREDTTTFVFTGDTTVVRLGPSSRTFGYAMANTIQGEMHMVLIRQSLAAHAPAPSAPLPGPSSAPSCTGLARPSTAAVVASATSLPMNVVHSVIGLTFRYRGDTIWQERDTTVNRTIYRGDTVTESRLVNDVLLSTERYLVDGDSARPIPASDGAPAQAVRAVPAPYVGSKTLLQSTLSRGPSRNPNTIPPRSPAQPISYCTTQGGVILQHGDTARYVDSFSGRASDTTTFVFTSDTTVKRVSPPVRDFGATMANTIWGDMTNALTRQSIDARGASINAQLPGARQVSGCGTK